MKGFLSVVALAGMVGLISPAAASSPTTPAMRAAFGNTVESHYPDGGVVRHWFNADGTYSAHFSDGRRITATWRREGERLCLNGIRPAFMMISRFCSPMIEAEVGETWQSRDPLGRRVQNRLVAGR